MRPLDKTDRGIISLLQKDGRMPFVKMAEVLGVTEGTVRRKINYLFKNEIVKTTAICNPYTLGLDTPAIVGINVERKKLEGLASRIAEIPEVQFVAITTGPYEMIIQVVAPSNRDLYDFLIKIGKLDGIINTHSFLMLKIVKQSGITMK